MDKQNYNGWTNYETWAVNLWLGNEPKTYNDVRNIVKRNLSKPDYQIADRIKKYVENLPSIKRVQKNATMAADLINSALSEVDWTEIVEAMKEE